ncbi:unnamed protein product [Thelazia callipaeda]|uniref:CCDC66 domain-containing protein n=1 Tax=Thelazia callipaeda TaxID=103827 RepID=A0A0N5CUQ3_THECL|nr:unnamed protein product [Thelazia callipaeda]
MVRTYNWNPSTQSTLPLLSDLIDKDEKKKTNLLPFISSSTHTKQSLHNDQFNNSNHKNISEGNTSNIAANENSTANTLQHVSHTDNSHLEYSMTRFEPQVAWLHQIHHQFFPVYCHLPTGFTSSICPCRSHIFSSETTTPIKSEQMRNLELRPVQIGDKIYYEPIKKNSALQTESTSFVCQPVITNSSTSSSIPKFFEPRNQTHQSCAFLSEPVSTWITSNCEVKCTEKNDSNKLPTSCVKNATNQLWSNNHHLQMRDEVRENPSWYIPSSIIREDPVFDGSLNSSNKFSAYNSTCRQQSFCKTLSSSRGKGYQKMNACNTTEKYKRELQQQIEQNRRRKEKERQMEMELERREKAKLDEYRQKVEQEMIEERCKEEEKLLVIKHRTSRMLALQNVVKATIQSQTANQYPEKYGEKKTSSTAETTFLEWWEKKKILKSDTASKRLIKSPVIPALRNKDEVTADLIQNANSEIPKDDKDIFFYVPSDQSTRSRSSSRLSERSYQSSMTSKGTHSSNSMHEPAQHAQMRQIYHRKHPNLEHLQRKN